MSVLEGMASGLPCVITTGCNFPGAADVTHIVDADADEIAAAMLRCLQYPEAARAMGDRAREFVLRHYTWHRAAEKLIGLYERLINPDRTVPSRLSVSSDVSSDGEKVERS